LLETVNSAPGEVFTFAPVGTPQERLSEFRSGGLLPENLTRSGAITLPDGSTLVPVVSLLAEQAKLLRETMRATGAAACIVDDYCPRWSESPDSGPNSFGVDDAVYHLLGADDGEEAFRQAVRCGDYIWHGVAAVCREVPDVDDKRVSTAADLERCAASALLITCTAYDAEGFVVWRQT
jgi:hypothetical protein